MDEAIRKRMQEKRILELLKSACQLLERFNDEKFDNEETATFGKVFPVIFQANELPLIVSTESIQSQIEMVEYSIQKRHELLKDIERDQCEE